MFENLKFFNLNFFTEKEEEEEQPGLGHGGQRKKKKRIHPYLATLRPRDQDISIGGIC
jgi:hypothetical protein